MVNQGRLPENRFQVVENYDTWVSKCSTNCGFNAKKHMKQMVVGIVVGDDSTPMNYMFQVTSGRLTCYDPL